MVVYIFVQGVGCAVVSRDLSQAERKITIAKAEKIRNMTTIFTQNDNFCSF